MIRAARLWLAELLLALAEAVAPEEVRAELGRLRRLNHFASVDR